MQTFFRKHRPDYLIIIGMLLLVLIGLVVIYSVSPALVERINVASPDSGLDHNHFMYRQLMYLGIGFAAFMAASFLPLDMWRKRSFGIIITVLVINALLIFMPESFVITVNGATRWYDLGIISFQPAEILKFSLVIFMAAYLASRIEQGKLNSWKDTLQPLIIVLIMISFIIVVLQKDMGTMIAILSIFLTSLFISGVQQKKLLAIAGGIVAAGVLLVISFPHRMQRVLTLLGGGDESGSGYHIQQALIAVGSGGLTGRGLGQSIQAFGYLPEAANDSIFAIFAEKFGFIGVMLIFLIFGFLFFRILKVMTHAPSNYTQLIVAGVFGWLVAHAVVNIGAMTGLLPLTGITLPFLSFGGTSLLFIMAALGLVINVSRYTTHQVINKEENSNANSSGRRRIGGARYSRSGNS